MDQSKLNEQILQSIFKKIGHGSNKTVSMRQVRTGLEHIDADTFFDTVAELTSEGLLLDLGQGFVTFSPVGWEKIKLLIGATSPVGQNKPATGPVVDSTAQKGNSASKKQSTSNTTNPLTENMAWLIELMTPNLSELKLAPEEHQKALEHLANLKTLMASTPNPALVKAVCASLKKTTEGAINSLMASGAQPAVWGAVLALFGQL